MYVSIHHTIADSQKWGQTTQSIMAKIEQGQVPAGLKPLMYLPSVDGRTADCVWEATSVEALKNFVDGESGTAAKNDYTAINADAAIGLPGKEAAQQAV